MCDKVTIAMVLKTGGVYDHTYVNALAKSIKDNVTIDHELVCITDDPKGFSSDVDKAIRLSNNFPTWWSKIELFKKDKFETNKVFYLDLDTVVIDNIDHILKYNGYFLALKDFYNLYNLGSGLMLFNPNEVNQIYDKFLPRAREISVNYREGDQRWIGETCGKFKFFQDLFRDEIVSFKVHCRDEITKDIKIPDRAKIVCFHGLPRPHMIDHPILKKYW